MLDNSNDTFVIQTSSHFDKWMKKLATMQFPHSLIEKDMEHFTVLYCNFSDVDTDVKFGNSDLLTVSLPTLQIYLDLCHKSAAIYFNSPKGHLHFHSKEQLHREAEASGKPRRWGWNTAAQQSVL